MGKTKQRVTYRKERPSKRRLATHKTRLEECPKCGGFWEECDNCLGEEVIEEEQ